MNRSRPKIIFAGTPDFAAEHLRYLLEGDAVDVLAVYTQPDRPAGRGKKVKASAVKLLAQQYSLPIEQPLNFKSEADLNTLTSFEADLMIVVAYGIILPQAVLDAPRLGCINVHASLLPRWRGAAPIQRAIEAGDTETGITIMQMDKGLDTGAMLGKIVCSITDSDNSAILHDRLIALGGPLLGDIVAQLSSGTAQGEEQDDSQSCYAHKITKQEAQLLWSESAPVLAKKVAAFNPFPMSYFQCGDRAIRVWQARVENTGANHKIAGKIVRADKDGLCISCSEGELLIQTLQMPGKKSQPVSEFLNAYADDFTVGTILS